MPVMIASTINFIIKLPGLTCPLDRATARARPPQPQGGGKQGDRKGRPYHTTTAQSQSGQGPTRVPAQTGQPQGSPPTATGRGQAGRPQGSPLPYDDGAVVEGSCPSAMRGI